MAQLDQLADPERLQWAKVNYPTAMELKGVTVLKFRPIVKDLKKRFKKASPQDVIQFTKALCTTRILEAQQIAFEVLESHQAARQALTLDDLLELGEGLDNWVSVDYFAGFLAGPAWREGQIPDDVITSWAVSEDLWWRRAAVVCTVALNQKARGGTGDPDRTLQICGLVAADQEKMVAKSLSRALRELAKRNAAPVVAFIDQHQAVLPKQVIREVRRKIETGQK